MARHRASCLGAVENMRMILRITTVIGQAASICVSQAQPKNAVTVLTSNSKQSGLEGRDLLCPQRSAQPMRFKDHREVHARVVERAISATLKPLKLHVTPNLKSPSGNTRANRLEVVQRSRVA